MISEHFSKKELIYSSTAIRKSIDNTPDSIQMDNLNNLCKLVLEPLRLHVGPIKISSGFRCDKLNKLIGGAKDSYHTRGLAADISVEGLTPKEICLKIIELKLPFAELILEFDSWTHVAYGKAGKVYTAVKVDGKTKYLNGII